jgi:hypothetical protein
VTATIDQSQSESGAHMRYCFCGKPIPRRKKKGGREKEYCCDAHRQQACRARNKDKHDLDRIRREADERFWNKIYQDVHRENWQDRLEEQDKYISQSHKYEIFLQEQNNVLREYIKTLEKQLADKEAEIVRLTVLLEGPKRKRPSLP